MNHARSSRGGALPPWTLGLASMTLVQLGSALSIHLIHELGAGGTSGLRLAIGALMFLVLARPSLRAIEGRDLVALAALGTATAVMNVAFLAAIAHIPLGTTVSIEFLGPLSAAAFRSHSRRSLVWLFVALVGVVLLSHPWQGHIRVAGIGFACLAGVGWGSYILLTHLVGDRFSGIGALSITVSIAALLSAPLAIGPTSDHASLGVFAAAIGLAALNPVAPFALELEALRRMTPTAFGTLMALEPAIALILGVIALSQTPAVIQLVGIILVVLAGAAAQRPGPDQRAAAEPWVTDVGAVSLANASRQGEAL